MRSAAGVRFVEFDKESRAGPTYRRNLSFALAEVHQIAFLADLPRHLIGGKRDRAARRENPDAMFFCERTRPTHRAQSDLLTGASISRATPASNWNSSRSGLGRRGLLNQ